MWALTGSVMSPPAGETAPKIVTDASAPDRVLDAAAALVEGGERRGQAGRVALLGGQLAGARGDLALSLRPAGGRVGDHDGVVAHVAVVLGDGRRPV